MRANVAAAVLCLSCIFVGSANAVKLGEYQGTLADGTAVSVTLDKNPVSGNFRVSGASVSFQEACPGLGGTVSPSGWTWNPATDFVDGKATILMTGNAASYIKFLAILREGRISGSFEYINAVLVNDSGKYLPTLCGKNQFQRADLDYQAGPAHAVPPAGGAQ